MSDATISLPLTSSQVSAVIRNFCENATPQQQRWLITQAVQRRDNTDQDPLKALLAGIKIVRRECCLSASWLREEFDTVLRD